MTQSDTITRPSMLQYALIALPLAFAGLPAVMYAPDLYVREYGLSLAAIGIVLLILRTLDALSDPVIGVLSDRFAAHRHRQLALGATSLGAGFAMLFLPPLFAALIWFTIAMALLSVGFSVVQINHNALGSLWSKHSHTKTRIVAMREAIGICGLLLAVLLPPGLALLVPANLVYSIYAAVFLVCLGLGSATLLRWLHTHQNLVGQRDSAAHPQGTGLAFYRSVLAQQWQFYAAYLASMLAASIPSVVFVFFVRDYLRLGDMAGLFLALYFVSALAGIPVWQKLTVRYGKVRCWQMAMLAAIIVFPFAFFIPPEGAVFYAILCVLTGFLLGAELTLPASILSDVLDADKQAQQAGAAFGLLAFLLKLSLGLAACASYALVTFAGFTPDAANSSGALIILAACYALLPIPIKIMAVHWLRAWSDK